MRNELLEKYYHVLKMRMSKLSSYIQRASRRRSTYIKEKEFEMLVLSRKPDESIIIGRTVEVRVCKVKGNQVTLGITAPADVTVNRKEIQDAIDKQKEETSKL